MTNTVQSPYTSEQIVVWLRGLLTIAWADGQFDDQEKNLIAALTQAELAPGLDLAAIEEPITSSELAASLGQDPDTAENFLRTAVMVAIADGTYSPPEDQMLRDFCAALRLDASQLDSLRLTLPPDAETPAAAGAVAPPTAPASLVPLRPVQDWLDQLEIHDPRLARFLCKMIPSQCPFERDVTLFGRKIVHIPPLCKINPLYEQLVGLRFRALSYLADDCQEDVTPYL